MRKLILKIASLCFFVIPPLYFIFSRSASASVFNLIGISGCTLFIITWLIFSHFFLSKVTDKINGMITQWSADLKVEDDKAKQNKMRRLIGKYENYLLALKLPLPTLIILGMLNFLGAVEQTAANLSAMLGICSCFWMVGVILLFISNINKKH